MKERWRKLSPVEKVMFAVRLLATVAILVLGVLQISGVWNKAINLMAPIMGGVLILQSIQEWNKNRTAAIFGLCAVVFITGCAIAVWFLA